MNVAPPKEVYLDVGRTLNHMLLWLVPEDVTGKPASSCRLCLGD
jgi:hypothetical protein